MSRSTPPDINELNLPKTCEIDFSDQDDLLHFRLLICPDEVGSPLSPPSPLVTLLGVPPTPNPAPGVLCPTLESPVPFVPSCPRASSWLSASPACSLSLPPVPSCHSGVPTHPCAVLVSPPGPPVPLCHPSVPSEDLRVLWGSPVPPPLSLRVLPISPCFPCPPTCPLGSPQCPLCPLRVPTPGDVCLSHRASTREGNLSSVLRSVLHLEAGGNSVATDTHPGATKMGPMATWLLPGLGVAAVGWWPPRWDMQPPGWDPQS